MERLRTKLKSETGASITYGLLLFLVCAVLSSVILVSSTAAAGRVSKMTEMDQRYYTVTSAAELMRDLLDGKSATIIDNVISTQTKSFDESGVSESQSTPENYKYIVSGKVFDINYDIVDKGENNVTYMLVFKSPDSWSTIPFENGTITNSDKMALFAAYKFARINAPVSAEPPSVSLNLDFGSGDEVTKLKAEVTGEMDNDGNLTLQIKNTDGDPYIITMEFEADKQVVVDKTDSAGEEESGTNRDDNKIANKSREITKTYLTWDLTKVHTVGAGN